MTDQINKHLDLAREKKQPVIPVQHLAKLANIAHVDERTNMEVPDSIVRLESGSIDYDKYSESQLLELKKLIDIGKQGEDEKEEVKA